VSIGWKCELNLIEGHSRQEKKQGKREEGRGKEKRKGTEGTEENSPKINI